MEPKKYMQRQIILKSWTGIKNDTKKIKWNKILQTMQLKLQRGLKIQPLKLSYSVTETYTGGKFLYTQVKY